MRAGVLFSSHKARSTSLPSGNQVDGLPLVAHIGARVICRPIPLIHCPVFRLVAWLVLVMLLFVLNCPFRNYRYIYDLNSPKGASLSMDFGPSWCRPKHRNEWQKLQKNDATMLDQGPLRWCPDVIEYILMWLLLATSYDFSTSWCSTCVCVVVCFYRAACSARRRTLKISKKASK